MKIDLAQYSGPCVCGTPHSMLTKEIIIEVGALRQLGGVAERLHLPREGVVVCDTNTRPFAELAVEEMKGYLDPAFPLVVLEAKGLHADEKATAQLSSLLPGNVKWLLAVGSGTIHDTTRYVANERGLFFVSFPTAATVDGFVSTVSAMTWHGFKKTMPGVAPLAVVADTNIFGKAPAYLTAAGIGDVIGKYTSLADWKIAHLVTGETYCPRIVDITREAVDNVRKNLTAISAGSVDGMEQLMFALLLSGIAMQMQGNSRPASGAEHHLSHLWEMGILNPHTDALHGEKVGVGLCLILESYKEFVGQKPFSVIKKYKGLPLSVLQEKCGVFYKGLVQENTPDPLAAVDLLVLEEKLPAIGEVLRDLPDAESIKREIRQAGCHTTLEEIGLSPAILEDSLFLSPFVRNRLTFQRLKQLLGT